MIISRQVYDPRYPYPNTAGRTNGIYGHWPKFYKCKGPADQAMWDKYDEGIQACSKPKWHLNYRGYLRLILPKGSITLWYMGNPYRHKILEWDFKK